MAGDVNWGLVIAAGVVVGLLVLIVIAGLYLLLTPPPATEPLGTPDGMLAEGHGPVRVRPGVGPLAAPARADVSAAKKRAVVRAEAPHFSE